MLRALPINSVAAGSWGREDAVAVVEAAHTFGRSWRGPQPRLLAPGVVKAVESRMALPAPSQNPLSNIGDKKSEIYTYEFPNQVYAMNWTVSLPSGSPRLRCNQASAALSACGSHAAAASFRFGRTRSSD